MQALEEETEGEKAAESTEARGVSNADIGTVLVFLFTCGKRRGYTIYAARLSSLCLTFSAHYRFIEANHKLLEPSAMATATARAKNKARTKEQELPLAQINQL